MYMQSVLSLLSTFPYIDFPNHFTGWLGWLFLFGLLLWVGKRYWDSEIFRSKGSLKTLGILLLAAIPTTLLFGLRFSTGNVVPLPGIPIDPQAPVIMFFAAIPWVLAAGILGPIPAVLIAAFSGTMMAIWQTHSLYTPLVVALIAMFYSVLVTQRYRTLFFRILRHPMGAAFALLSIQILVYIISAFFAIDGSLPVRLDFALTQSWSLSLARWLEMVIASIAAEVLFMGRIKYWRPIMTESTEPSPGETSLEIRFLSITALLIVVLVLTLILGDWIVTGRETRKMILSQMTDMGSIAAESLPYFLETGQNLIKDMVDEDLISLPSDKITDLLAEDIRTMPYFRNLLLLDGEGQQLADYPPGSLSLSQLSMEEEVGIDLAEKGVAVQVYAISPSPGENSAQFTFIAAIESDQDEVVGVMLGRSDLNTNPFTQPVIQVFENVKSLGGEGLILDENNRVLYHTSRSLVMTEYFSDIPENNVCIDEISATGSRQIACYQRVDGRPWTIVLTLPADFTQQPALDITAPKLVMLVLFSLIAIVGLSLGLRKITRALKALSKEATLIAQGEFSHSLSLKSMDEVGRFGHAFDQMRQSLRDRQQEMDHLLSVSKGVASSLDVDDVIEPLLQAALSCGGDVARLLLIRGTVLDARRFETVSKFGHGPAGGRYNYLDDQILEQMRHRKILTITNTSTMRLQGVVGYGELPATIFATALRHENQYYGVLWVAHTEAHTITEEEMRFMSVLSDEAALSAANARLYANAEVGRQRLEAVLSSTPEPVLVFDKDMRLLLLNPISLQVPGLISSSVPGQPIQEVIENEELRDLFSQPLEEDPFSEETTTITREITLGNNRNYYVSISSVTFEELPVGKVCILRDITSFKELDTLKSEFVATVSHDLRSPLTMMKGYASMLPMVGNLNDQQGSYVTKILSSIEDMNRLVNNLLDLGRVEAGIGLRIADVSPLDIVEGVVSVLQPQATQQKIRLIHQDAPIDMPGTIQADAAMVKQAIYNLVENAIKYTQMGGKVGVGYQIEENALIIEVLDTGIGIAPLDLPHTFEKFYRSGRREAHPKRGTGLGLAIVKSIVERHHGRVWVESYLGKGSKFSIEIPFTQPGRTKVDELE
jgi:two-component system, OmpR family, phosphate regulon sensor histidine kinase PhoR